MPKLAVSVEIWYNLSPIIGVEIEAKLNRGGQQLWGELEDNTEDGEFPWRLYMHSTDIDDGNCTFKVQFKHRSLKDSDSDELKRENIKTLCRKLLESDPQDFARNTGIQGGVLNWKPASGEGHLSISDKQFGMAFCIERSGIQEEASNIVSRGPHPIVVMSDILGWFTSHIEQLQAMLPPAENTEDSLMRAALVLLDCLKVTRKWGDMANTLAQLTTQTDKSTLELEANRCTDLFMAASTRAQEIFAELTSSASQIEIRSTEDVKEATDATAVTMQHALLAYKASEDLAGAQKRKRNLWGIGIPACAIGAVGTVLTVALPFTILPGLGAIGFAAKAGFHWKKQRKWQKASRAIFEVGTVSHQIWLFLMLHLMCLHGLPTNTEAFRQFARNMAETFDGIAVDVDWQDVDYVQNWVKEKAAYMQNRLENVSAHTSN